MAEETDKTADQEAPTPRRSRKRKKARREEPSETDGQEAKQDDVATLLQVAHASSQVGSHSDEELDAAADNLMRAMQELGYANRAYELVCSEEVTDDPQSLQLQLAIPIGENEQALVPLPLDVLTGEAQEAVYDAVKGSLGVQWRRAQQVVSRACRAVDKLYEQ